MKFLRLLSGLPLFSALLIGTVLGCSSAEKFDTSTPEGAFKQAEFYEKEERYEEAIQKYADVRSKHPYSRLATDAELKIADLHFKREAYLEAQSAYQLFKEFHPKHPKADYVTFRLALSYFNQLPPTIDRDLSVAEKAIPYFDEVMNSFPNSEFAAESKKKKEAAFRMMAEKELYIADFYSKRKNYDSALKRYEVVVKTYPNLGFDARALYGAAKSAFESGEKDRGRQHLKNLNSLFPGSDEAKRARDEFEKSGTN